jgi:hypothetical protein
MGPFWSRPGGGNGASTVGQRISTGAEGITSMDVAPLLIARPDPVRGGEDALLLPAMANRHG